MLGGWYVQSQWWNKMHPRSWYIPPQDTDLAYIVVLHHTPQIGWFPQQEKLPKPIHIQMSTRWVQSGNNNEIYLSRNVTSWCMLAHIRKCSSHITHLQRSPGRTYLMPCELQTSRPMHIPMHIPLKDHHDSLTKSNSLTYKLTKNQCCCMPVYVIKSDKTMAINK